jgi:hypothetical protein
VFDFKAMRDYFKVTHAKSKMCLAVNTGCSARVDERIYVPVTFVAGNNLSNAILRLYYQLYFF